MADSPLGLTKPKFKVGDRIAYSGEWLQATNGFSTQECFLEGQVRAVEPFYGETPMVTVVWDGLQYPHSVAHIILSPNLRLL